MHKLEEGSTKMYFTLSFLAINSSEIVIYYLVLCYKVFKVFQKSDKKIYKFISEEKVSRSIVEMIYSL